MVMKWHNTILQHYIIRRRNRKEFRKGLLLAEFGSVLSGYPFYLYPFYPDIQPIYPDIIWIIRLLSGYPKLSGYPANFSGYPADILLLLFLFKSIYQIYLILSVVNGLGKVPVGSIPTSNLKKIRQR